MNKRTTIITILFGILSAVSTYFLLQSMDGFKTEVRDSKNVVKELQGQVTKIEDNYKGQIQYWMAKNAALQNHIQETETALNESRQHASSLKGKIQLLISESKTLKDTSEIIANCDSLKEHTMQFMGTTTIRDSLCDNEINDLKCVIQNKDSAMTVCENSFTMLKTIADSSLTQQSALIEELNEANKKIKRSNLKTKFLSAAVMVLATSTTIFLLKK